MTTIVNQDEPHDIYIGRPSKWGNPFSHIPGRGEIEVPNREEAIRQYRLWITEGEGMHLLKDLPELRDKRLACWCKPQACHGDVLVELTNNLFTMYYTGVGARTTPIQWVECINYIAALAQSKNLILRSGHAGGADTMFEMTVNPLYKDIYLPWEGFNGSTSQYYIDDYNALPDYMKEMAKKYHPNWGALKGGAKKLMMRNLFQVLGHELNKPSRFLVCWTADGKASGGTGFAIRCAEDHGVPVFNLKNEGVYQECIRFINSL